MRWTARSLLNIEPEPSSARWTEPTHVFACPPFLFSLDAERAHGLGLSALDLAYRTGTTPLLAARIAPMPSTVFGLTFPIRSAWPPAWTERRAHRCTVRARLRLRRNRHHHPAPAGRQSATAPVPPAGTQRHHQPHGLQQCGRGCAGAQRRARAQPPRPARHQHRQEQRHTQRTGRGRLHRLPGQGVPAGRLHHRQHLLAQHRRPA